MSLINRVTSKTIPASFFAIPLGLVALGLAWQTAESIWSEPKWVSDTLIWAGVALWILLLMSYVGKWLLRRADAVAELEHPIQSCSIGLAAIATLAPYLFIAGNIVVVAIATVTIKWAFSSAPQSPPVLRSVDQECT